MGKRELVTLKKRYMAFRERIGNTIKAGCGSTRDIVALQEAK